jgi:hypothetical protein
MKAQKCVALLFFLLAFGQLCALVMALDRSSTSAAPNSTSRPVYITHVTVIDTKSGKENRDRTVIISGNRILDVEGAAQVRVPAVAKVVDAAGKYLIPYGGNGHRCLQPKYVSRFQPARRARFPD